MSKLPDIKKLIDATKLRYSEIAAINGVTRAMAYRWADGAKIHPLRVPRVLKLEAALLELVKDGSLPLNSNLSTSDRMDSLRALLVKQLRKSS